MDDLNELLSKLTANGAEAYKIIYEFNASALYEMSKDPHQVVKFSRMLRQVLEHSVGSDAYSAIFEAGKLCGYVEAFEAITKNK